MCIRDSGNLGYITAVFFKTMFPDTKLYIFGVSKDKLSDFTFADATYQVSDIPENMELDHAFECVGGAGSGKAIDQIIDFIKPEGTISILGVSEYPVPINTRMILEKGLDVYKRQAYPFRRRRERKPDFYKDIL